MSRQTSFVDASLRGEAFAFDIDDFIDRWHDAEGAPNGFTEPLSDFLGMSPAEYRLWVERPESLRFILAARRNGRPLHEMIRSTAMAVAARAEGDDEAADVLKWLIKMGRVSDAGAATG